MKRKFIAILITLVLAVTLVACGKGNETTITGMVVSVDGTMISLMEMDTSNMAGADFSDGERPDMPEGMEDFQGFGDFDPEDFEGMFPEGGNFSPWGNGEIPEMPEGMTMPQNGEMPNFGGDNGAMLPGFGNFDSNAETKDIDIGDAHISVEIDGGKASGSMSDIEAGTFVTITMNGKGEVTNVLVSSQSFLGSSRRPTD